MPVPEEKGKPKIFQKNFFEKNVKFLAQRFGRFKKVLTFAIPNRDTVLKKYAEVAQLVEHNLAKVGVARSNRVFCSKQFQAPQEFGIFFYHSHFEREWMDALVVKLVDTQDLKSCLQQCKCGFKSRLGHRLQRIRFRGSSFICTLFAHQSPFLEV
jgi:hypothetical protein